MEQQSEICSVNCTCKDGEDCHADGVITYFELREHPRSWSEDYNHENGEYANKCLHCKKYFIGHKRRIICKQCETK